MSTSSLLELNAKLADMIDDMQRMLADIAASQAEQQAKLAHIRKLLRLYGFPVED